MRHRKSTAKLGRKSEHRNMMLANLVCSLIKHRRVTTTLAKAKAARPVAEKMLTLGKSGTIHDRRLAAARLHQEDAVRILFNEIAPTQMDRHGGYTRIIKLHERKGDAAQLAILEWVDEAVVNREETAEPKEKKASPAPAAKETSAAAAPAESEETSEATGEESAQEEEPKAESEEKTESSEESSETKKD